MAHKRVAIVQSNYVPWRGYFDLMASVDEFVLFDDVQYTRRDWRNRNMIKTAHGLQWLTLPVAVKGNFLAPGAVVQPGTPAVLPPLVSRDPEKRPDRLDPRCRQ